MDSQARWVIPLVDAADRSETLIGGKAAKLARLAHVGFRVPDATAGVIESLCDGELVTVDGYLGIVTVGPPEFELEGVPYHEGPA